MAFRKLLLRVLLWSLGIASVLGTFGILLGSFDAFGRIFGTMFTTSIAAGLMILCSKLMDKPQNRTAGMLGLTAIVVEFFIITALIWNVMRLFSGYRAEDSLMATALYVFLCTPFVMAFSRAKEAVQTRYSGITGTILTGAVFVILMISTWGDHDDWLFHQIWATTAGVTALFGLTAVAAMVNWRLGSRRLAIVQFAGIIASVLSWLIALYGIWMDIHESTWIPTSIMATAMVIAFSNLCLLAPLAMGQEWIRWGTIGASIVTASGVVIEVVDLSTGSALSEMMLRVTPASGFATSCGALALIILARMNRRMKDEPLEIGTLTEIDLICPGCKKKQTLPIGESSCSKCRLQITTRITEPRCEQCGYLVYMLTSDRCPECGLELPKTDAPSIAAAS